MSLEAIHEFVSCIGYFAGLRHLTVLLHLENGEDHPGKQVEEPEVTGLQVRYAYLEISQLSEIGYRDDLLLRLH